jgi:transcriptional regulator with XRE-family HTH domain
VAVSVPHSHTRLARTLKGRRAELLLRPEAIATLVGVSARTIERYEAGSIIPSSTSLRLLARTLGLELVELELMARTARTTRQRAARDGQIVGAS